MSFGNVSDLVEHFYKLVIDVSSEVLLGGHSVLRGNSVSQRSDPHDCRTRQ
jgi:hypothetical protein